MWQSSRVLLIDDQCARQHDLKVVLDFVGEGSTLALDRSFFGISNWQDLLKQQMVEDERCLGALIAADTTDIESLIAALMDWDLSLPVIRIIDADDQDKDLKANDEGLVNEYPNVIASLECPPNYTKLMDTLHRAQVYRDSHRDTHERRQRREAKLFRSLVGTSRSIIQVRELMAQVADKEVNVLITGESGTGKEVVARNLHYHSHRRDKPFVPVNCGAIPAELLESELFGHEKGAFTGAVSARPGRFEMAKGGTLFLDEIGDMPLHMQVKILRVLQEKTYERVGGTKTYKTDVRIIAATHRHLEEAIREDKFREDLYYRLNVFPIEMPALRERTDDIPLLLNELIARVEHEKRGSIRFNSASIMALCRHEWPGNVRELANLVERLVITHPYGVVGVNDLPRRLRHVDDADEEKNVNEVAELSLPAKVVTMDQPALLPVQGIDLKEYLSQLEINLIKQALDDCNGVVARAAERLQIRRTTLVEKMRKYDVATGKSVKNPEAKFDQKEVS